MVFLTHVCEDKYENGNFEHLITDTSVSPLGLFNILTIISIIYMVFKEL